MATSLTSRLPRDAAVVVAAAVGEETLGRWREAGTGPGIERAK